MSTSFSESDQTRIEKNLALREDIINIMTENGIPPSYKERRLLMELADSMDKTVLGKVKIVSDEKVSENAADVASFVAKVLIKTSTGILNRQDSLPPFLDDSIVVENPVEGEKEIGISKETYEQFMERMLSD